MVNRSLSKINSKWLVRIGALLILMGFVLPSLTVSCAMLPGMQRSLSLAELAGTNGGFPVLYLVALGALATLILAFLPSNSSLSPLSSWAIETAGIVIGALSMILTLLSNFTNLGDYGFDVSPEFGLWMLIGGYLLAIIGLWTETREVFSSAGSPSKMLQILQKKIRTGSLDEDQDLNQRMSPLEIPQASAWLRVLEGGLPQVYYPLASEIFTIGRDDENDLVIPDKHVSRLHARLCYSHGSWFIQDQNSAAGISVNGKSCAALRLKQGDQITIGENILEFNLR